MMVVCLVYDDGQSIWPHTEEHNEDLGFMCLKPLESEVFSRLSIPLS